MTTSTAARPIFVIGAQRSGTTLLQGLLGAHPAIAAPPELHFWFRVAMLGDSWGDRRDPDVLARIVHEALHPPLGTLDDMGVDEAAVVERAATGDRSWPSILDALLRTFAEQHGKPRWSEKSPGQPAGIMARWFPTSQLVHIVRDPRDCVVSNVRAPWGERDAGVLARRWREHTLASIAVGSRVGPDRYLRIRYEDLVRDPEAVLRVVLAFLDEPWDPRVLEDASARTTALSRVAAPFQARLLDRPSPRDVPHETWERGARARTVAITHDLLEPLGYATARPAARVAGHALNVANAHRRLPDLRWRWEAMRARRDPARLPALVERYQQRAIAPLEDRASA